MRQQFEKRGRHMWERLDRAAEGDVRQPAGRVLLLPQRQRVLRQDGRRRRRSPTPSASPPRCSSRAHVAVVPGNDSGFDTHVRLSFATSMEQIDKGIDRIEEFLKKLG